MKQRSRKSRSSSLNLFKSSYSNFDATVTCHYDYRRLEKYIKDIIERYKDSFQHAFLKPTRITFMYVGTCFFMNIVEMAGQL